MRRSVPLLESLSSWILAEQRLPMIVHWWPGFVERVSMSCHACTQQIVNMEDARDIAIVSDHE
jgi:hypothetical protein